MNKRIFFLGLLASAILAAAQENYSTWSHHGDFLLNTTSSGAGVSGNTRNFPVLFRLGTMDSAVFSQALPGGADLRFTKPDGTRLRHQIELWDSTGRNAAIWVLVDTIWGNNFQTVQMYWGKAGAVDSSNGKTVFDTANGFQAVWHMNGASNSNEADATTNNFTARDSNGIASTTTAVVGLARTFTGGSSTSGNASGTVGSNECFIVDSSASGPLNFPEDGHYTISGWFRPTDNDANRSAITKGDNQYALKLASASTWEFVEYNQAGTGTNGWQSAQTPESNNAWVHLVGVRDGINEAIYKNGVLASNTIIPSTSATVRNTSLRVFIGKRSDGTGNGSRFWAGQMDEIRMANVSRDSNWVKLDYENQKSDQSLVSAMVPPGTEIYPTWSYHKNVIINTSAANVTGNVAKFPLLIRLDSTNASIFAQSFGKGADIRFTKADNTTRLPHQIERWDSAGRNAAIWILVDTVHGSINNQFIRMHWGKSGSADSSSGTAVFDSANGFQAVWHMSKGDTTGELDATVNAFNASEFNGPTDAAGVIGHARMFNGTDQRFQVPSSAASKLNFHQTDSYTLSAWMNPTAISTASNNGHKIIDKGDNQYVLAIYDNSTPKYWEITTRGNGTYNQCRSNGTPTITGEDAIGAWHHLAGIYKGGAVGDAVAESLYYDGALINTSDFSNTSTSGRNENFNVNLGAQGAGTAPGSTYSRYWNGLLDEVRMSNTVRSHDWIKLSYENQKAGQTMVYLSDTIPVTIGRVSAARMSEDVALSAKRLGNGLLFQIQSNHVIRAHINLMDMRGRTVWTRRIETLNGMVPVIWDGYTRAGQAASSGVYILRMTSEEGNSRPVLQKAIPFMR